MRENYTQEMLNELHELRQEYEQELERTQNEKLRQVQEHEIYPEN